MDVERRILIVRHDLHQLAGGQFGPYRDGSIVLWLDGAATNPHR